LRVGKDGWVSRQQKPSWQVSADEQIQALSAAHGVSVSRFAALALLRHTDNTLRPHQALDEPPPGAGGPRRRTRRVACGRWRIRSLTGRS
jgi:hypothetical protein